MAAFVNLKLLIILANFWKMCSVSNEGAIYILYCEEFNITNVIGLSKKLYNLKDLQLCYESGPTLPVLVLCLKANSNNDKHYKYKPLLMINDQLTCFIFCGKLINGYLWQIGMVINITSE